MNYTRILLEFKACGLEADYIEDDSAVKSHSETFDMSLHNALVAAHVASEIDYLGIDLESNSNSLALKSVIFEKFQTAQATSYWENYLGLQLALIREKRQELYKTKSDPIFLDIMADSGPTGDFSAWHTARQEIQTMFPYPGTYR